MQPANPQLIWDLKRASLSPQIFIAFFAFILAVSGGFNALSACDDGFHSVRAHGSTHSVQLHRFCTASAMTSLKATIITISLPQRTYAGKSAIKPKSAMYSAGFAVRCPVSTASQLHTAFVLVTFCQNHIVKSLHTTPCEFSSKMQYCKNLCLSRCQFLQTFVKSANICVLT